MLKPTEDRFPASVREIHKTPEAFVMRSKLVMACIVAVALIVMGLPVFAQEIPFQYELQWEFPPTPPMPAIPPIPPMAWSALEGMTPMPEIPPMPPMPPSIEGFTFGLQGRETVDPNVRFQQEVFRTLVRTNADRAMEIATDRLKADPGDPVVLGNLAIIANSSSTKALPLLISIAKTSTNVAARREAASTIGRTRDKDGLTILEDLYSSSGDNVDLRRSIVSSIGRSSDPRTVSVLANIVRNDTDESIRRNAIQYLGNRKEPEALKVLEDLLKEAPKPPRG
jgi:hypothetical protein